MELFEIIKNSRKLFFHCVKECNEHFKSGHGFKPYREIIDLHRSTGDLEKLLELDGFVNSIWRALEAWGMNQQSAKLNNKEELKNTIFRNKLLLTKLYEYKLHELDEKTLQDIVNKLGLAFGCLKVMKSKRRIVGVSKALHFLIPDLIIPMDGRYTIPAFFGRNKFSNNLEKETDDFMFIFRNSMKIAKDLNLTDEDVTGEQWNTSVPKLIDNAIIGLWKIIENKKIEELKSI
jgi:hypothetical protein